MRHLLFAVFFLLSSSDMFFDDTSASREVQVIPNDDPWEKLSSKKAWVLLGYVSDKPLQYMEQKPGSLWATRFDFQIVGSAKIFPEVGDSLITKVNRRLIILGFEKFGERDVEFPPTTRKLIEADYVPGMLIPGSKVVVHRIEKSNLIGTMRIVYALVSQVK